MLNQNPSQTELVAECIGTVYLAPSIKVSATSIEARRAKKGVLIVFPLIFLFDEPCLHSLFLFCFVITLSWNMGMCVFVPVVSITGT